MTMLTLKCTSHGGMYGAGHLFGKISLTSKQ